ncbi:hypothetical protein ABTX81_19745 [Kitasatospora sp. NPDC097605]|uniref:hypothetical protein n=1 Tax=Kitasatospora sp. NPDC097605 TaxID=3157226 RepID=UPI003318518D
MTQPVPPMQRPRYFDYQFLRADDFDTEQRYHRSRRELLTALFYSPGVVSGLTVTCTDSSVTVAAGYAVDRLGRLVVLPAVSVVPAPGAGDLTLTVTVRYSERATDPSDETGVPGETRWTEEPRVELVGTVTPDHLVLGTFRRSAGKGTVTTAGRVAAGLVIPGQYTVKGNLTAEGDLTGANLNTKDVRATGAIVPSVGNTAASGIMFPRDPGGGTGDEAFIRYFPYNGENTQLVIGNGNDVDDLIDFSQGARTRLRIGGGMLHTGKLDGQPAVAGEVLGALGFHGHGVQHAQFSFRAGRGFEFVDRSADWPSLDYAADSKPYADVYARNLGVNDVTARNLSVNDVTARNLNVNDVTARNLGVNDVRSTGDVYLGRDKTLVGSGNLYLAGPGKTVVSNQYFGGSGLLHVQGGLSVGDYEPALNRVTSWDANFGGGLYLGGTIGDFGSAAIRMYNNGDIRSTGIVYAKEKKFLIDHPLDPERKYLLHTALEGPENGVYQRGEGRLADGRAVVELPEYFEALTLVEGRTVQLTPVFEDDDEPLSVLAASRVRDGRFTVRTVDGSPASHAFHWEVKAVRADIEPLVTEVGKADFDRRHEAPAPPPAGEPA